MGHYLILHIREDVTGGLRKRYKGNFIINAHYRIVGDQIDVSKMKSAAERETGGR
jgi:hypothetical protein